MAVVLHGALQRLFLVWCLHCFLRAADAALRAQDAIFAAADLHRERHVLLQPGDRVVLVDEKQRKKAKKKRKKSEDDRKEAKQNFAPKKVLDLEEPDILQSETVTSDMKAQGIFHLPWLKHTSLQVATLPDFIKPIGKDVDVDTERELVSFFDEVLPSLKNINLEMREEAERFMELVRDAVGGNCFDDRIIGGLPERKIRALLTVLGQDTRRLAWVLRHLFREGYVAGDEVCFMTQDNGESRQGFEFRMHVWHDYLEPRTHPYAPGPHDHGTSMLASVQIRGSLVHHVFQHGGVVPTPLGKSPLGLRNVTADLYRDDQVHGVLGSLDAVPFRGETVEMPKGSIYIFPPRWIHSVEIPRDAEEVGITLELRMGLAVLPHCSKAPLGAHVIDQEPPDAITDLWQHNSGWLRRQVFMYLVGDMKGELVVDGPEIKSPLKEGHLVRFNVRSKDEFKRAFRRAPKDCKYDSRMLPMLGPYTFEVVEARSDGVVSLKEPGDTHGIGPENGFWYFPENALSRIWGGDQSRRTTVHASEL